MIFFGFGASHLLIAITFAYFLATSISWVFHLDSRSSQGYDFLFLFLLFSLLLWNLAPNSLALLLLAGCIFPLFFVGSQFYLILSHFLLLFWAFFLVDSHSFTSLLLILLSLDLSSLLLIALASQGHALNIPGNGPWFYLLFQSLLTLFLWFSISTQSSPFLFLFFFSKLGAGIAGYYLPFFYRAISFSNLFFLSYTGLANMVFLYIALSLFLSSISSLYFSLYTLISIFLLLGLWSFYGHWFHSHWLYLLSSSSLITSSTSLLFLSSFSLSLSSLSLLTAFLLASQFLWANLLLALLHFS